MGDRLDGTLGELDGLVKAMRAYLDALADIAVHGEPASRARALSALHDGVALIEERRTDPEEPA
jgi:hypothetical protein